jgi:hypothetical protein
LRTDSVLSSSKLSGDFSIQVDYRLPLWPPNNGVRIGIGVSSNIVGIQANMVERVSGYGGREVYLTHFADGVAGISETNETPGKLKLERSGIF